MFPFIGYMLLHFLGCLVQIQPYYITLLMLSLGNFEFNKTLTIVSLLNSVSYKMLMSYNHLKWTPIVISLRFKLYKNCIISNNLLDVVGHKMS